MAKITRIVKTIGRTINLGNFNSMKIEATIEAQLEEKDVLEDVEQTLFDEVESALKKDYKRIMEKRKGSNEEN